MISLANWSRLTWLTDQAKAGPVEGRLMTSKNVTASRLRKAWPYKRDHWLWRLRSTVDVIEKLTRSFRFGAEFRMNQAIEVPVVRKCLKSYQVTKKNLLVGNSSWFAITTTKHSCHCHEGCKVCVQVCSSVFKCVHFCGWRTGIEPCSTQGLPPTEAGNMEISWHFHNILDNSTSQHPYFLLGYTFQWAPQSHQIFEAKTRRIFSIILTSPTVRVSMYEVSGHNGFLGLLPKNRTQQCYCQHSAKRWRHATWSANENMALYSAYWTSCVWRHMATGQKPGTLSTLK